MIDEFAKFDGVRGRSLDDVFGEAFKDSGNEGDLLADLDKMLKELVKAAEVPELDGYYPYRLLVGDRYFYPVKGTMRVLPIGHTIFVDAIATPDDEAKPIYTTVLSNDIMSVTWLPGDDAQEDEPALEVPLAA